MFAARKRYVPSGMRRGTSKRRYASGARRGAAAAPAPKARLSRGMSFRNQIFYFRRNASEQFIYMQPEGGNAPTFATAYQFQLNQLPNYQEFTALFDMYRINKVVVRLIPTATQVLVNSDANSEECPLAYAAIDYNDATSPADANEIKQYGNCRVWALNKYQTFVFCPRTASPVYRDGATNAYLMNPKKLFIDCNYADVPHYGIRLIVPGGQTRQVYRVRVESTFYLSFRNQK